MGPAPRNTKFGLLAATALDTADLSATDIANLTAGLQSGSSLLAGVPEPATWGLMLVGFFGLGSALRRRRAALAV